MQFTNDSITDESEKLFIALAKICCVMFFR